MNSEISFLKKLMLILISFILIFIMNFDALSQSNPDDFVNNFSITDSLKVPVRAAIDIYGNIFVTDNAQKCIIQYDSLWNFTEKIYIGEEPTSIAISNNNTMFVGDYRNGKIYKRLPDGIVSVIYADTIFPSAMVASPDNELYVVDSRSKSVLVMDFAGKLKRTLGSGVFLFPTGIAFDSKNNRVIVSEHGGFGDEFNLHAEIRIFGTTGNLISTFGGWGNSPGKFYRVQGLAVGRCGNIYVTDPYQGNISVFNENGTYITKFGVWGNTSGKLNVPMDVVFDARERVYVVSLNNNAIEVLNITDSLPSSTIKTGSVSICEGTTTPVKIQFTGTAPWTFTYTIDGSNPQTITNTYDNPYILNANRAGAYNVIALSDAKSTGTCFSNTATVIIDSAPTAVIANMKAGICPGDSLRIPVTFTGTAPWKFTYTIDDKNATTVKDIYTNPYNLNTTRPGTYEITAVEGSSCQGVVTAGSATINMYAKPESYILNGLVEFCSGTSAAVQIELTGKAPWTITYTVDGQNPATINNIKISPFTLTVTKPGTYEVTALSDANCTGSGFKGVAVVTEHRLPESVFVSGNPTICANDSAIIAIKLSGTPPWTLTYTIDSLNPTTITGISSNLYTFYSHQQGVYQVVALKDTYCSGTKFTGSSKVTVNQMPIVNLGPDVEICQGQSVTLDGGENDFYLWNDFSKKKTIIVGSTGKYSLTATDIQGCQSFDLVKVNVSPNPLSAFSYKTNNLEVAFINISSNADSYFWDFGDGFTDSVVNPVHSYLVPGNYTVSLKASCAICGTSTYVDTVNLIATLIEDINSAFSFNVYPNPSSGIFTLDINNPNSFELKIAIFNSIGQSVYNTETKSIKFSEQINLSHLASGIYSIRLFSNDRTKTARLILTD
jgi:hypothetical protein